MQTGRILQTALAKKEDRQREEEGETERERQGERGREREADTHRGMGEVRTQGILRRPEWDTQTIAGMMAQVQWTRRRDESGT